MNIFRGKKGVILIAVLAFIVLFATATILYIATTTSGFKTAKQSTHSYKAFFLAESGIHKALYELRKHYATYPGEGPSSITWDGSNMGEYEVNVSTVGIDDRHVVSTGYFPRKSGAYAKRAVEVDISAPSTPSWFYDNAIVAGNNVDLRGNYTVTGGIRYGESINPAGLGNKFDGDFPLLDFEQLKTIAASQIKQDSQNNVYTQADIDNNKPFPTSFWFDEDNQIPNVVYVETNLILKGNVGTLGGFYVVAGDVITNPDSSADTTINGTGTIDGCVYTFGDFRINGGGTGLGVTGGVWGRDEVRLNGNAKVTWNEEYMTCIDALNIDVKPQITSWQEKY